MTTRGARVAIVNAFHVSVGRNIAVGSVVVWESGTPAKVSASPGARRRERASPPTARAAMAPALGKRPCSAGVQTSGNRCVHGEGWGGYTCKACPGRGICEHGRVRSKCKECGGGSICEHGRVRSKCKECGGGSICEHGRVRSKCKECGGSGICEHGRKRRVCKECGGASICEHGRHRYVCKECGGGSICEHGRRRSQCKECGGGGIFEHRRVRSQCKDCRAARDAAAPALHPPVQPKPEILVECEDVEDPGEEDERI